MINNFVASALCSMNMKVTFQLISNALIAWSLFRLFREVTIVSIPKFVLQQLSENPTSLGNRWLRWKNVYKLLVISLYRPCHYPCEKGLEIGILSFTLTLEHYPLHWDLRFHVSRPFSPRILAWGCCSHSSAHIFSVIGQKTIVPPQIVSHPDFATPTFLV